ncbi:MAG: FHA domain-containing protein [Fimbriimonadaceae bacterium]|nr:FHA domain-containing protein [Fimbriimonadaceae bacterium]
MRLPVILTVLFGLSVCAFAQTTIKLTMPTPGHRMVWVSETPPTGEPTDSLSFSGTEFEMKASSTGPETKLWVLDEETNNIAAKKLTELGSKWEIKPEDFTLLGLVTIRIEHKGERVESASVKIADGARGIDQILDSGSNGQIVVYGLMPGTLKAAVTYKSGDKTMDPLKQSFDIALKRSKPEVTLVVSISDPVTTIKPDATGGAKTGGGGEKPDEGKDTSSPIGKLVIYLMVLAGAVVAIFFVLKWFKNNPTLVQSKLDQLGVSTPKGGDPSMDPAAQVQAPTPLVPPPPQKIVLDDGDPSLGAPLPPTSASSSTAGSPIVQGGAPIFDPRLVGENGQLFTITDGEFTVGREGAHAVLLAGESTVSRNHAEITCSGQRITVKDTGSTNGTFVNGVQLHDEVELKPGDSVQFGSVRFRFEV